MNEPSAHGGYTVPRRRVKAWIGGGGERTDAAAVDEQVVPEQAVALQGGDTLRKRRKRMRTVFREAFERKMQTVLQRGRSLDDVAPVPANLRDAL